MSSILNRERPETTSQRPSSVAATVGSLLGSPQPFAAFAAAQPALTQMPPPLPAQMLVDLLKNPFCVDEARRVVLGQLSRHYNRHFADQWEFADFVHANEFDLDLSTPPERPR